MKLELSLEQIEANLDNDCLRAVIVRAGGNTPVTDWMVKRNGKTKLWKRDPTRFEIPVKVGFRAYDTIDSRTTFATDLTADYRVVPSS